MIFFISCFTVSFPSRPVKVCLQAPLPFPLPGRNYSANAPPIVPVRRPLPFHRRKGVSSSTQVFQWYSKDTHIRFHSKRSVPDPNKGLSFPLWFPASIPGCPPGNYVLPGSDDRALQDSAHRSTGLWYPAFWEHIWSQYCLTAGLYRLLHFCGKTL